MRTDDELALAAFFNPAGNLFSPALTSDWTRPSRVELRRGMLTIWGSRLGWPKLKPERRVRPGPGLLESFLSLADTRQEKISAGDLMGGGTGITDPTKGSADLRIAMAGYRFSIGLPLDPLDLTPYTGSIAMSGDTLPQGCVPCYA